MNHNSICGIVKYTQDECKMHVNWERISIQLQSKNTLSKVFSQPILSLLFILSTKSEGDKYSVTHNVTEFTKGQQSKYYKFAKSCFASLRFAASTIYFSQQSPPLC